MEDSPLWPMLFAIPSPQPWATPGVRKGLRQTCKGAASLGADATSGAGFSILPADRSRCVRMLRTHHCLQSATIIGLTTVLVVHDNVVDRSAVLDPWRAAPPTAPPLQRFLHDCSMTSSITEPGLRNITRLDLQGVTGLSPGCAAAIALHLPLLTALSLRWDCTTERERSSAHADPLAGFFPPLRRLVHLTKLVVDGTEPSQADLADIADLTRLTHLSLTPVPPGRDMSQLAGLVNLRSMSAATEDTNDGSVARSLMRLVTRLPAVTHFGYSTTLEWASWQTLSASASLTSLTAEIIETWDPSDRPPIVMPAQLQRLTFYAAWLDEHASTLHMFEDFLLHIKLPGLRELHTPFLVDTAADAAHLGDLMKQLPLVQTVTFCQTALVRADAAAAIRALLPKPRFQLVAVAQCWELC